VTKRPLNILHVLHQYLPEYVGGTELYAQTLAEYQARAGHNVSIFAPASADQAWPQANIERGVRVYRFPTGNRSRQQVFFNTFRQTGIREAFAGILDGEKPDLVHSQHGMGLPTGLYEEVTDRDIPLVITIHDYWYICGNAQLITNYDHTICAGPDRVFNNCGRCAVRRAGITQDRLFSPLVAPMMANRNRVLRNVFDSARQLIFPSNFTREIYSGYGLAGPKGVVIPHGFIVPERLLDRAKTIEAPAREMISGAAHLRIGYVGSLAWQKGVHILVEAANRLPEEGVTIEFYGGLSDYPEYSNRLRQMSNHPGITFHGRIDHDQLWSELASLDVLVFPTLWYECSPLVIQEAFAAGVPLVASRIGAVEENIQDGQNGLLFPAGDAGALYEILLELYHEPAKLISLRKGIKPVRTMAAHLADVLGVYSATLGKAVHN